MDLARADILAPATACRPGLDPAQRRILPPPAAAARRGLAGRCARARSRPAARPTPLAGAGWTLHPLGPTPQGRVDARWLDASRPAQRAELFAGLPLPGDEDEAAPFAWAHRALCRSGLRLRIGGEPARAPAALRRLAATAPPAAQRSRRRCW
jgi:Fe-S cluster assembly protein SufD